jgi:hypothetical protein
MRVLKYRDITRLTLYGRYDKNINDATSIYSGYDRALTTTTGGGINAIALSNAGTIGFTSAPNVYIATLTQNTPILATTLSATSYNINSIAVTTGGSGWTSAPNVYIYGTGTGATATATVASGAITAIAITNNGSGYTAAPTVSFNGGGFITITATTAANILTGFTITSGGTGFTSPPTIVISGTSTIPAQTTTCTLTGGVIATIALPAITLPFFIAPTVSIFGGGNVTTTATLGNQVNSIILPNSLIPLGTFTSQPIVSYNGGGVINITAVMNGNNTIITGFTITNGGYAGICFTSQPTIIISGGGGYATTTCTLTNGVITAIATPTVGNNFTSAPTVSVSGGGLPTITATLYPYNTTIGGYSPYQNTKRLRFDLNQELQALKLADNADIYLEFVRMPALSVNSTCFKNLRLVGASNVNIFDSIQGTTGNPILFTCESGNVATNYTIASTDYNKLPIPSNFLNKGYIEFEMETILNNNTAIFTAAQLNEFIVRLVIEEPDNEITQDNNLGPEYSKGRILHFNHHNK